MQLNISGFLAVLPTAVYGILGVFVVMALIYGVIRLLLAVFPRDKLR